MSAPESSVNSDLRAEFALPGTDNWQHWADFEEAEWRREFDLTAEQFNQMYAPYEARSVLIGIARATDTGERQVGASRMLLPNPNAHNFDDAGLLIIHAVRHGTPGWGKLHISDEGWERLGALDPRIALDTQTHVIPKNNVRDPRILSLLNSMQFGLSLTLGGLRHSDIVEDGSNPEPTIVTGLVRKYRDPMIRFFTHKEQAGVELLGDEMPYGETDPDKFTTTVLIPTNTLLAVDNARRGRRRLVHPEVFDSTQFVHSTYINQYLGGQI